MPTYCKSWACRVYPCPPSPPKKHKGAEKKPERPNPDAVLLKVARQLQASPSRLRAMLSDDDMRDIAEGQHSRAYLIAYFTLMRADGKSWQTINAPDRHGELIGIQSGDIALIAAIYKEKLGVYNQALF